MKPLTVCIRCNAGHTPGYGHASRCLALADAFKRRGGADIVFVLGSEDAACRVRENGYVALILFGPDQDAVFAAVLEKIMPDILVLDVRPPHALPVLLEVKKHIRCIALVDDVSEQRLAADVVYLPPVPAVERVDWSTFKGRKRVGLQWMLTGGTFAPSLYRKPTPPLHFLMTMGGSDPWGYTMRLAPVFAAVCQEIGVVFGVVTGPGFKDREQVRAMLTALPGPPVVFDNPENMSQVYDWCDAAVAPMCVSAYELAYNAKPALYICTNDDYKEHAQVFEYVGLGAVLPLPEEDGQAWYRERLLTFLRTYMGDTGMRERVERLFSSAPADMMASDIMDNLS
jgi:spore coat polysaccharide biosynthesis protein SpsF